MQPTTSFELLERVRAGGEEARSQLFERYRRRLVVLIACKLGPEWRGTLDPEDLAQETLLRAHRDLGDFHYQTPGSFLRWLSAIADHAIADAIRYQGRERRRAAEVVPISRIEPVDSATPSRVFAQEERVQRLVRLLDELPEQYREVLVLTKLEGLTIEEVSQHLGKPRPAVSLLVFRAAQRLRELLDRNP
jgi:RNA polymerase sigma-70 factor, ECF subfamily